ncbi:PaeR7I family type II restriction endonuclease [Streptomyces goshikiensis]|uniref:PaeR7I family type II restriction endonuclease n=1 Tax=Streptomyces goshikiensis TaxID=1942 RepID=UPI0022F3EF82|nr:PaeR7I family type II restriction endonuclease [Streptomyces goshikiensis]WBY22085.1 type II site-specific deoxyribonuclease [Streptomyces goshikiensis]
MAVSRQDLEGAISSYWKIKEEQAERARAKKAAKAAEKKRAAEILASRDAGVDARDLATAAVIAEAVDSEIVATDDDGEDSGTEGSVRGGKQFDPIADVIARFFREADYPDICIHTASQLELPGFYRPQKKWDLVVNWGETLVAAFELKALGGPSYGNNFNNRVEEAVGSATDVRRAFAEIYPDSEMPWLGYLFIMQDDEKSQRPVGLAKSPLLVDETWRRKSYQGRGGIFCERLLQSKLYDGVCYVTAPMGTGEFSEPSPEVGWDAFSDAISDRISALRKRGIPSLRIPRQAAWSAPAIFD